MGANFNRMRKEKKAEIPKRLEAPGNQNAGLRREERGKAGRNARAGGESRLLLSG